MNLPRRLVVACAFVFAFLSAAPAQEEAPPQDDPGQPVSYQVFYDGLVGAGRWVNISGYGSCWQPLGLSSDWAPYIDGHWTYTEDGWTWVSEEAWGWAVYHYGRWIYLPDDGWFWVPGYTWGPAWVRWRYGGGYCGWAPLPPQNVTVDARWYNFCRTRDIGTPNLRGVILGRDGNAAYLGQTDHGFHRQGPDIGQVNGDAFRKVPRLSLHRTAGPVPAVPREEGDRLHVYAPEVQPPANGVVWHSRPAPAAPGAPTRPDRRANPGVPDDRGDHGDRDHGSRTESRPAPAPAPAPRPEPTRAPSPAPSGGGPVINVPWMHH